MQNESSLERENARLRGDLLTMASRVSHDLRTPLGGIVTATEMLNEILAEKNLPVTRTQIIFDSVDDLNRLIRKISFITRATANPIPKKTVRMDGIVAGALQRVESQVLKKQATITRPDSWPQVDGVTVWLEEIWWNFLINALQHTTDKPRIELSWRKEGDRYRFEISDQGGGVPEEIRKGLFRPFHSLHESNGTKGLGLSVVQRLVELQGGDCGYEPKPGGSCFFFSLPLE
jgi:signal transduction histidine kinase